MDCDDCLERLYPYLDRELAAGELEQVRRHLDDCHGCDRTYLLERLFLERVKGSATADVAPPAVRERLILRLRHDVHGGS